VKGGELDKSREKDMTGHKKANRANPKKKGDEGNEALSES